MKDPQKILLNASADSSVMYLLDSYSSIDVENDNDALLFLGVLKISVYHFSTMRDVSRMSKWVPFTSFLKNLFQCCKCYSALCDFPLKYFTPQNGFLC